jgi:hypothetical protein
MQFGDNEATGEPAPASVPTTVIASNLRRFPIKVGPPAPVFHPIAYRGVVAAWPVEWRERWGLRANALEEQGLSWRDAEAQSFVETWNQRRSEQSPLAETARERSAAAQSG